MERNGGNVEGIRQEGYKMLEMLGLAQYADVKIKLEDGSVILATDFLTICGDHARAKIKEIEQMPESPMRDRLIVAIKSAIFEAYIQPSLKPNIATE